MALVRRRIERLGDDDLQRQLWFLRASLAALSAGSDQMPPVIRRSSNARPEERIVADRERLLTGARAVGNRLEALALRDGDGVSWVGLTLTSSNYWSPAALGANCATECPEWRCSSATWVPSPERSATRRWRKGQ